MINHALELAATFGFRILPVNSPLMGAPDASKRPLIAAWQHAATTDPDKITAWFRKWPQANIGVATGAGSKVYVLDVDLKTDGIASFERLKADLELPPTLTARSGSGGYHYYFRHPLKAEIGNSTSKLGPGLDIRGDGGFVVAPPSMHACGQRYEWVNR